MQRKAIIVNSFFILSSDLKEIVAMYDSAIADSGGNHFEVLNGLGPLDHIRVPVRHLHPDTGYVRDNIAYKREPDRGILYDYQHFLTWLALDQKIRRREPDWRSYI